MKKYYQQGFKAGYSDGKKGETANVMRHLGVLKAVMSGEYTEQFTDGYQDGFNKGYEEWCKRHS